MLACPGDVFDEVIASPVNLANWRAPFLLVCLTGIAGLHFRMMYETEAGGWPLAGSIVIIAGALLGNLWSALVLWIIGRVFLGAPVSFWKALEVAGLAGCILALANVVGGLLFLISGNTSFHLSLGLFGGNLPLDSTIRRVLETLNIFYLWNAAVLTIGLSKLSGISMKEAAFWVLGYWIVGRVVFVLLS